MARDYRTRVPTSRGSLALGYNLTALEETVADV